MELYSVAKEGVCRGYFLLAHAPGQTRIADFYVDSEGREDWRALVELAVLEAKRNRMAAEVVAMGSDSVTRQTLLDCGFHARGNRGLHSRGDETKAAEGPRAAGARAGSGRHHGIYFPRLAPSSAATAPPANRRWAARPRPGAP